METPWRTMIARLYAERQQPPGIDSRAEFHPAASSASIGDAEVALNAAIPDSLRSFYTETNGVMEMLAIDGGEWFESMWLIWPIEELVAQNLRYLRASRESSHDFHNLVAFAGAGADGVLFAFPVSEGVCSSQVMAWHPIGDELNSVAPDLEVFLRGWLDGAITI